MITLILNLAAVSLYFAAGFLLAKRLVSGEADPGQKTPILWMCGVAVVLHCVILYADLAAGGQWRLGLTNALSFAAVVIAIVYTALACQRPIENLGAFVLPVAGLSVLAAWIWPAGEKGTVAPSTPFTIHLVVSVLAYAFLTLAVVQALLLNTQEKHLHRRHPVRLLKALPPIQTMETLLFVLTGVGFTLLTFTLISGIVYTEALFGVAFSFDHHTVLSILAWVIFGILLLGHFLFGWRGRHAAHWTIGGFVVLVLAYFGTKYVVEVLLA